MSVSAYVFICFGSGLLTLPLMETLVDTGAFFGSLGALIVMAFQTRADTGVYCREEAVRLVRCEVR